MIAYNKITSLYVAPKGWTGETDGLSGTEYEPSRDGAPFPDIPAALTFIRELRRVGVNQPVSVRLLPGIHCLGSTVRIDPGVTGVTIEPFGSGDARVIGGVRVENWIRDEFGGVPCLSAPIPAEALNPDAPGGIDFTDFYVNGTRAKLTRYPAEGWLYADDVENHDGRLFSPSKWFIAQEGDFKGFRNIERVQLSFCHYWIDEHTPIEAYDPETRRVTMLYPSRFGIDGGPGTASRLEYCLENVAETFGNPDEWYAEDGRIYYIPRDGSITPETVDAYIPRLFKLFELRGEPGNPVRNIRFRGLSMGVTRGEYGSVGQGASGEGEPVKYASDAQAVSQADGSLSFAFAANCSVEDCRLENFGVHGFVIDRGCHGIRILRTLIRDGGAGGVKIIGGGANCPETERTFGNAVEDCRILYCGRRYFAACGVLMMHTFENTVAHNEIGWLYYTGVSCGWIWGYAPSATHDNRIEKNHIHHLGDGMLSDMGGVYLLGLQPGTVVSGNVIHDVRFRNYGGWALYTDEGSSFITLENNVCWNTSDNAYHQHYGSMNTVRNNIFAFSDGPMMRVSRTEAHMSILFENNIVYSAGSPMFDISRNQIAQGTVSSAWNLYFDTARPEAPLMRRFGEGDEMSMADFRAAGMEYGSVIADPLFMDAEAHDFRLKKDSPAYAIGFCDIDTSDVGPRI